MVEKLRRAVAKIRRDGPTAAFKAVGRSIHGKLFGTEWDFTLIPHLLDQMLGEGGTLTIVQIGANVGNTGTDQIYTFLKRVQTDRIADAAPIKAVLIEPVRHLYEKLVQNYAGFQGISCVQAAIAESAGY